MNLRFGSVCSGIEAASVAWEPLGWKAAWLSEIEPFPSAVLKHHYPEVPNLGDMTLLPERILDGEVEAPELLCGGCPCQAFSVAGLRNSLDDHRGNLTLTFIEIANAIDDARSVRGEDPAIIFYENVPGILNTKDNAFGCFLGGLAGENDALVPPGGRWTDAGYIDGPERAIAWRVLDAQYFGVAQRRKRVFVVASARANFDPAAVLFEFDGLRRDIAPSRETGQDTPAFTPTGFANYGDGIGTLRANGGDLGGGSETLALQEYGGSNKECADTVTSKWQKGSGGPSGNECGLFVAHVYENHPADSRVQEMGDVCHTVTSRWGTGGGNVPFAVQEAYSIREDAKANTFHATPTETSLCVGALVPSPQSHHAQIFIASQEPLVLEDQGGSVINTSQSGVVGTLRRESHGHEPSVVTNMAVRRLTPTECERLQGFPDGYTNIPWRKKPESPDGPRYKALGNSWAVPVVRWIGQRIARAIA